MFLKFSADPNAFGLQPISKGGNFCVQNFTPDFAQLRAFQFFLPLSVLAAAKANFFKVYKSDIPLEWLPLF